MAWTSENCDLLVVGGGIVGACVADELARTGASVLLVDAGDEPGHATPRAAGIAVPSLRYLTDPEFYGWLRRGYDRLLADISALEPEYGAFSAVRGILRALRPADARQVVEHAPSGDVGDWIGPDQAAELMGGHALPADRRYLFSPDGLVVNGSRYLGAARSRAVARGVRWSQGTEVLALAERAGAVDVTTDRGTLRADRVVLAAGAWSGDARFGTGVPVFPLRGQLVRLRAAVLPRCVLSSAHYLAPDVDGLLVVGATEEDVGFDDRCTVGATARLLRFALGAMPSLADATPVAFTAGLRPASRTGHPVVGRVPGWARVYVAAGHAGHGLLSARHTAEGLVRGLLSDDWDELPESLCPLVESA
jgi:glycine oxidase